MKYQLVRNLINITFQEKVFNMYIFSLILMLTIFDLVTSLILTFTHFLSYFIVLQFMYFENLCGNKQVKIKYFMFP